MEVLLLISLCPSHMGLNIIAVFLLSHPFGYCPLCATGPVVKEMVCGPDYLAASAGSAPTGHVSLGRPRHQASLPLLPGERTTASPCPGRAAGGAA